MPNWVMNKFEVTGSTAEIHRFLEQVKDGDLDFSFNKILPMPKSLNIVSGGHKERCILAYALHPDTPQEVKKEALIQGTENPLAELGLVPQGEMDDTPLRALLPVIKLKKDTEGQIGRDVVFDSRTGPDDTFDSHAKYGKVYFENWKNYGSADWYDWRVDHWGTKWGADNVEVDEPVTSSASTDSCSVKIMFTTAWSMPEGIFEELIKQYPGLSFSGVYADEDIGSNCGAWSSSDGELVDAPMSYEDGDTIWFACEVWGYDPEEYLNGYKDDEEDGSDEGTSS